MKKPHGSKVSVRTALFSALLILGGWSIVASIDSTIRGWIDYRASLTHSQFSQVSEKLLTAAQHMAFERGRTAVVLRGKEKISDENRTFIQKCREIADINMDAALAGMEKIDRGSASVLLQGWNDFKSMRKLTDHDFNVAFPERKPGLIKQWEAVSSDLLMTIQQTTLKLSGHFTPGSKSVRLNFLTATILDIRTTTGSEASKITQALVAGQRLKIDQLEAIYSLRGREKELWENAERVMGFIGEDEIAKQAESLRRQHLEVLRPLQDKVLSNLASNVPPVPVSTEEMISAAVPILEGISSVMTMVIEKAKKTSVDELHAAKLDFFKHALWTLSLVVLLAISLRYVSRKVIRPIELIDAELRRLNPLAPPEQSGNEIDRLSASVGRLEQSLIARSTAEEKRIQAMKELQEALDQIKTLRGFLPICASCKKIRNDKGYWEQLEEYISKHTDAQFSHGICPECYDKAMKDF